MWFQAKNAAAPLILTPTPSHPWQICTLDIFTLDSVDYCILAGFYSKVILICNLPAGQSNSAKVIHILEEWFCDHGTPEVLCTENGPQYAIAAFPDYQQSNGFAESVVKIVKHTMQHAKSSSWFCFTPVGGTSLCFLSRNIDLWQNGCSLAYSLTEVVPSMSFWMIPRPPGHHSVACLVHLLSFSHKTCPAHQYLLVQIWCITSVMAVFEGIQLALFLSYSVSPINIHSILHCVRTIFCSCILLRDHVSHPYMITRGMHSLCTFIFNLSGMLLSCIMESSLPKVVQPRPILHLNSWSWSWSFVTVCLR